MGYFRLNLSHHFHQLASARIKNQTKKITEQILDKSDYKHIEDKQSERGLTYKQIVLCENFTMTVTYSPKRAEKDKYEREEAKKKDGLKGIVSNTEKLSPLQQIAHYAGLWQVVEAFRISKHDVKMRPIYHWALYVTKK